MCIKRIEGGQEEQQKTETSPDLSLAAFELVHHLTGVELLEEKTFLQMKEKKTKAYCLEKMSETLMQQLPQWQDSNRVVIVVELDGHSKQ